MVEVRLWRVLTFKLGGGIDGAKQGSEVYLDFNSYSGIKAKGDMSSVTRRKGGWILDRCRK